MTESQWRLASRRVIAEVLATLPADAPDDVKRKAVEATYPFGERAMLPYKMWRQVVNATLGPARKPKAVLAAKLVVQDDGLLFCGICHPKSSCLFCAGPKLDEVAAYRDAEARALMANVASHERPVVADWLDERGYPRLAAAWRQT